MADVARVIALPVRRTAGAAMTIGSAVGGAVGDTVSGVAGVARRVPASPGMIDDWGRDPAAVRSAMLAAQLRWSVTLGGVERLPERRGALIVLNTRRFALSPIFAAFAVARHTGRPVRFVGRPDTAPVGAIARSLGALLDDPDEVGGALRAGELVVLGASPSAAPRRVGEIDHFHVGAAIRAKVPVFPAATTSTPMARRARVEIGELARSPRRRRGPLLELELADRVAEHIELLLDEMGEIDVGWPFDGFPLTGRNAR